MKPQRLARWGGSASSPRIGTMPFRVQVGSSCNRRSQTSVAALHGEEEIEIPQIRPSRKMVAVTKETFSEHKLYPVLSKLPSPPTSAALSSAKLSALHARLRLPQRLPLQSLAKCLVHPSADPDERFNNLAFAMLGHDILGYHTSELILCTYPRLPMDIVYAAMRAYVGPEVCGTIAKEWGVEAVGAPGGEVDPGLLQFLPVTPGNADVDRDGTLVKEKRQREMKTRTWTGFPQNLNRASLSDSYFGRDTVSQAELAENLDHKTLSEEAERDRKRVTLDNASSTFVRAVVGALYLHAGRTAAKEFFDAHIRPRKLDVSRMFYFKQPTRDLGKLCAREGFERPVGRILSETGRFSRNPVFNLGVFSGREKLGEGSGGSLDEARIRASISALKGWYLYSPVKIRVPSDVEGRPDDTWEPVLIDGGEVIT